MQKLLTLFLVVVLIILVWPGPIRKMLKRLIIAVGVLLILLAAKQLIFMYSHTAISLEAAQGKNEAAAGSEIWLKDIIVNGESHSPTEIFGEGWIKDDGRLIWREYDRPAGMADFLQAYVPAQSTIQFVFQANQWRGKVKITVDGKTEMLDCYHATTGADQVTTCTFVSSRSLNISTAFIAIGAFLLLLATNCLSFWCGRHFKRKHVENTL